MSAIACAAPETSVIRRSAGNIQASARQDCRYNGRSAAAFPGIVLAAAARRRSPGQGCLIASKNPATFAKRQREQEKKRKAEEKLARRVLRQKAPPA
jgi:hypothetical protein